MFVCRRLETTNLERLYSNWIVATAGTSIFICRANCFDCFSFTVWVANNNWYYQINWMYILNLTMIRVFHPQSWPSLKIGPSASQLLISNIRLIHFVCCCLSAEKKTNKNLWFIDIIAYETSFVVLYSNAFFVRAHHTIHSKRTPINLNLSLRSEAEAVTSTNARVLHICIPQTVHTAPWYARYDAILLPVIRDKLLWFGFVPHIAQQK